ncbi:excisionase family DNA-binding protein [Chryseobacterium arthrosphaerae]|uniref:excisionase family DNA-binding protein n=1 Tax=Chryseobacterium arthrosphaerae TaxID=651561 RepID=UPI0023E2C1FF|nr:excisionase family DNA-binding protein [Chryseobacterium arthrosphaerae]WES98270.1 excisionase family DNA-binding protein [Chryseobacterium arthrosphaerae]
MITLDNAKRPTKREQLAAIESYSVLSSILPLLENESTEIEIKETKERIKVPLKAMKLLNDILKVMSEGKPISIVPIATEVTTQKAAEILGCSRPHIVKLLEDGVISFTKVGKHRRILFEDILKYRNEMKKKQKNHLIDIMNFDEEIGLYDS